jgi:aspartate carbamoyltransferase
MNSFSAKIEKIGGDFKGKDIISVDQFTDPQEIEFIFQIARQMRESVEAKKQRRELADSTLVELFYQPSTRTFTSFQAAALWLGCRRLIAIPGMAAYSSAVKGESLIDTIRTVEQTTAADLIILRHPDDNSSERAALCARVPVINAGSGKKEHPTQAILDLYTIQQELGRLNNLHVVMLGDLKYGRTVKSLAKLLALVDRGNRISLVSPKLLRMPDKLVAQLKKKGVEVYQTEDLAEVLPQADVLYVTRIQKEWFAAEGKLDLYQKLKGGYDINLEILKKAKKKMIVMHPLPRVGEIAYEVDADSRAAYFRQMRNGLYTRMALLAAVLGKVA